MASTPAHLLALGQDYARAFDRLFPRDKHWAHPDVLHLPAFNALGHAYELALKSFLLAEGVTEKELQITYSHDLAKLYKEAKSRKILVTCTIKRWPTKDFELLNQSFGKEKNYWLRYAKVVGLNRLPPPWRLRSNLSKLIDGIDVKLRNSKRS